MIVVDTGPLVAIADADDQDHARCVAALGEASQPLIVPVTVLAEVCYLLERELGTAAEAAFLQSFRDGTLTLAHITLDDLDRMAELVTTYADLPLGAVDASAVAIAERLGGTEIATLDRRHFTVVRPRHAVAFTLLPSE
ncbi:MAG: PIN domain-containing protein [Chloroflexota bacterium]|nr:PIN domain-containing protein [Chloroflexota bacterium]